MWTGVFLGTLGVLSSETWPGIWVIIEINLISFIALIRKKWSIKKQAIIYFIIQSVGSLSILSGGVMSDYSASMPRWLALGLLLKASLAPLHFWGALIVERLRKFLCFFFLTWQKIGPVFVMLAAFPKHFLIIVLIINGIVSACCSVGSRSIFVLIFFSGLGHIGWVFLSPFSGALFYFFLYVLSNGPIFLSRPHFPLAILNLAGLPPLTGFFIKFIVLQTVSLVLGGIILALSVPVLFAYLRLFIIIGRSRRLDLGTILVRSLGIAL